MLVAHYLSTEAIEMMTFKLHCTLITSLLISEELNLMSSTKS